MCRAAGDAAWPAATRNTPPTTTLLAALTTQGMGTALIIDGATDTQAFTLYGEQVLAPTLRPGQIVMLDNLRAHKGPQVRAAIEVRGCQVWFLPPYAPDVSPIELAFAKRKAGWRRMDARTHEVLIDAIAATLDTSTPNEARAFFRHCGYRLRLIGIT